MMKGLADKLGYYETHFGDYRYEKYIDRVMQVASEDINARPQILNAITCRSALSSPTMKNR